MAIRRRDMRDDDPHDHDRVRDHDTVRDRDLVPDTTTEARTSMVRVPFGIAQVVMVCIGIFFVALGTIALSRTGIDNWTTPTTDVGVFTMTPLLAGLVLIAGIIALVSAVTRRAARGMATLLGAILVAGGIVLLIQQIDELGTNRADAILFIVAGAAALLGAMATPAMTIADERSRRIAA